MEHSRLLAGNWGGADVKLDDGSLAAPPVTKGVTDVNYGRGPLG